MSADSSAMRAVLRHCGVWRKLGIGLQVMRVETLPTERIGSDLAMSPTEGMQCDILVSSVE